ncbi:MAG: Methionine synthase activation domain [Oscillospiraceae bacterium]|nr:Methionine synthase activation domain [Oscillospiraceae bacterium]
MTPAEIDWDEARRYAGIKTFDPRLEELLRDCGRELMAAAEPRAIWKRMTLLQTASGVRLGELEFDSADLRRHLEGCGEAALLAATLGVETDRLIRRSGLKDMSRALLLQACAASLLERCCDGWGEALAAETELYLTPRFSPGYGDFSPRYQRELLDSLNAAKRIGLTVTEGMMLAPAKSVTAVIGLTDQTGGRNGGCAPQGCRACGKADCQFRRTT